MEVDSALKLILILVTNLRCRTIKENQSSFIKEPLTIPLRPHNPRAGSRILDFNEICGFKDALGEGKIYIKRRNSLELRFLKLTEQLMNLYEYSPNHSYYRAHLFFWEETVLGPNEQIKCRAVKDAEKNMLSAWMVNYDERGNILEERIAGNLSGKNAQPLKTNGSQPTWGSNKRPLPKPTPTRKMASTSSCRNKRREVPSSPIPTDPGLICWSGS